MTGYVKIMNLWLSKYTTKKVKTEVSKLCKNKEKDNLIRSGQSV